MANVRFYKLEVLPPFSAERKGIFVHVTGTMKNTNWTLSNNTTGVNPELLTMATDKNLKQWLDDRNITEIASGLWFGGENGWELLSNDINSIDATINAKIAALDVDGYTQATISGSTLTISGIKEVDGKIVKDDTKKLEVAIDGTYNETDNKIATQSTVTTTVTTAINNLNANTVQAVTFNTPENGGNTTLTFNGVKETNGVIAQGDGGSNFIVGDAKLNIQIGSAEAGAFEVFSANAQSNGAIKLNENVFTKDENNIISVITPTAVASDNKLVTEKDVANLAGAMHYKGALTDDDSWPSTVAAGDVYIVTTGFTHSGESNPFEVGDLIVFNTDNNSNYTVVQSNITLGTGVGQVAANVDVLAENNIVVATSNGIKTTGISASVLEETNNNRNLTYGNVTGGITITDSLTVLGKNLEETINISSTNRSIKIARNAGDNDSTGIVVDLVWNTIIE